MTLPTTTTVNGCDDDSDIFGPPRSSPIGYHHHRSRVPMISPKMRQREERKRILQLCANKLEHIKDSETCLRRSVCINNTYCRLNDELRREKQSRYLANLPRSDVKPESARDNIFNPYNSCGIDNSNHPPSNKFACNEIVNPTPNNNISLNNLRTHDATGSSASGFDSIFSRDENNLNCNNNNNNNNKLHSSPNVAIANLASHSDCTTASTTSTTTAITSHMSAIHATIANNICFPHATHTTHFTATSSATATTSAANSSPSSATTSSSYFVPAANHTNSRKRQLSSSNLDNDLEILDRELSEINAPMPLIDPEITQGAEQLEKAISSRKRLRSEDESDRLVREALSQFYIPQQRLISAIEDCPLDVVSVGGGMGVGVGLGLGMGVGVGVGMGMGMGVGMGPMSSNKRQKISNGINDLELEFDLNQNQKDFEVIMDALRLGTPSPTPSVDSCGQAAMMSESASVFHNLVVTSLET
ncbi:homeobox protein 13 [Anastrepha obliqua]|uniref:homeobox protein 13 n=1 Tax=Anastrepha obliqua TaxID=95512 RepID=UPI00240A657D|nr:homeobox protein 13 [Anastrepha obliqua]XP_054727798.1 homeobox protein 13 [Anastrepha obliqua]XP_054727799.1 homeobox protein 13 [Anastrepha obliqua]